MSDADFSRLFGTGIPEPATGDASIKAKPTPYGDITFRSALEACWAGTLDRLDVEWQYEPEMITLPSGARYLPDFKLPAVGAWLEVKGDNIPRIEKARELGRSLACDCKPVYACNCRWRGGEIVIVGHPPRIFQRSGDHRSAWWANWSAGYGATPWFVKCTRCGTPGWTTGPACRACRKPAAKHLIAATDFEIEMAGR